jgi:exosome complex RNA-binding protein Rrp42 (RNase PH superfamily)
LLQVSSIASFVALQCTQIPKVQLLLDERGAYSDFEISSEMAEATRLDIQNVPICVAAYKVC